MKTPPYYYTTTGDLYTAWLEHYGQEAAAQHLEMCALEYLWRCRHKGQYRRDLEKVQVIVARLLSWADTEEAPCPEATLDDALHALAQHGWQAIPPPLPPAGDATGIASVDHAAIYDRMAARQDAEESIAPPAPQPPPQTVLEYCLTCDYAKRGVGVPVEVIRLLFGWGIPPSSPYAAWAAHLARVSEGRYPVEEAPQP